MNGETVVLCGANSYNEKYYLNPEFESLPEKIKKELKIICVSFAENVGGIITLEFDEQDQLKIKVMTSDSDFLYDEIESGIQVGRIQREKEELFAQLELYYKVFKCSK